MGCSNSKELLEKSHIEVLKTNVIKDKLQKSHITPIRKRTHSLKGFTDDSPTFSAKHNIADMNNQDDSEIMPDFRDDSVESEEKEDPIDPLESTSSPETGLPLSDHMKKIGAFPVGAYTLDVNNRHEKRRIEIKITNVTNDKLQKSFNTPIRKATNIVTGLTDDSPTFPAQHTIDDVNNQHDSEIMPDDSVESEEKEDPIDHLESTSSPETGLPLSDHMK
eukprot:Tbor_TRINITY_DN6110_c2_g1::TRINITY_DN6110_c2_g1_i6::g.21889::m.21889